MPRLLLLFFLSLNLAGCLQESPEELNRLIKEDPEFKQRIVARDQAHRQIQLIKQDLLSRKNALDTQFRKMRAEYDAYAKEENRKIDQFRASIEVHRDQLKKEVEAASASLETKQEELAGYQKTLTDVKKVLTESKGITLSKTERQKWEERVLMLSEKIRPLTEEIQEIRLKIRLKKQKIGFLK